MAVEAPACMNAFRAELHIHTVLSPCAEIEMLPPLIIETALEKGINLIAITDHNATGNIEPVIQAAQGSGITVLPGIEVQTREEVHSLCLFDTLDQVSQFQQEIDLHLPPVKNNPDFFGVQLFVDQEGEIINQEERLLITALSLTIEQTSEMVHRIGGLFIPAHVNRKTFSLLDNLGFVPIGLTVDALEISNHITLAEAARKFPQIAGYPLIQSGDAHRLVEILGANRFEMEAASVNEIKQALLGANGRKHFVEPMAT